MPMLVVYVPEGYSEAQKRALLFRLAAAVVEATGTPLENVRIILTTYAPADVLLGGAIGVPLVVILVYLLEGLSPEQKAALVKALTAAAAEALGVDPENIRVILVPVPPENFGVGNGKTAAEAGGSHHWGGHHHHHH
uniref:T33-ml30-redesigned-4-OT-fold n=1 Tax=synthetic construct TaxID=32630 RepID=UPI003003A6A6